MSPFNALLLALAAGLAGTLLGWLGATARGAWSHKTGEPAGERWLIEQAAAALREKEERMRLAVEAADIGTWDFNPVTGEQQWSARAKVMFGLTPDAELGMVSFRDRVHPDDREQVNQAIARAYNPAGDGAYEIECRLVWPDQSVHWFIAKGQAMFAGEAAQRRVVRFMGAVADITERKSIEAVIRANETRLKAIIDNMPAVISLKDLHGRYIVVNKVWEDLYQVTNSQIAGLSNYELIDMTESGHMSRELADQYQDIDRTVIATGMPVEAEDPLAYDRDQRIFATVKFPIKEANGTITGVGGISIDVTERRNILNSLAAEQDFLRHTIKAQDHQRQLVTYEIHDGLVQYVTGALMQVEALRDLGHPSQQTIARLEDTAATLRKAVAEGRRLIDGLHTPVLDDWGVVPALEQLLAEEERAHVHVDFCKDPSIERMDPTIEETVYRIAQEALTNIHKHSRTERISVDLARADNQIRLAVQDWGVGFVPESNFQGVHGIRGMIERARIVGGQCTIDSRPGEGTRVSVTLPYKQRMHSTVSEA